MDDLPKKHSQSYDRSTNSLSKNAVGSKPNDTAETRDEAGFVETANIEPLDPQRTQDFQFDPKHRLFL